MKNNKGFTLTEILIVLVVAGILLALILPNTLKAIERGNVTAHESNLNTLQVAAFMCYTKYKNWANCDTTAKLNTPADQFLTSVPVSPFGGSYTFEDGVTGSGAGKVACHIGTLPAGAKRCSGNKP